MEKIKLAIIYYSSTGTNYTLSKWAEEAAVAAGAEVKRLKIKETAPMEAIEANEAWKAFFESPEIKNEVHATLDDLEWADAIIWSIPTRYGGLPSQVQSFLDTTGGLWFQGKLANKIVSAMSSAQNPHGGQETTALAIMRTMMHWGCIVVPPGYTFQESFKAGGNPYGTSTATSLEGDIKNNVKAAVEKQAERTVQIALQFARGAEVTETS